MPDRETLSIGQYCAVNCKYAALSIRLLDSGHIRQPLRSAYRQWEGGRMNPTPIAIFRVRYCSAYRIYCTGTRQLSLLSLTLCMSSLAEVPCYKLLAQSSATRRHLRVRLSRGSRVCGSTLMPTGYSSVTLADRHHSLPISHPHTSVMWKKAGRRLTEWTSPNSRTSHARSLCVGCWRCLRSPV